MNCFALFINGGSACVHSMNIFTILCSFIGNKIQNNILLRTLRTTLIYHIENRKVELNFHPLGTSVYGTGRYSACYERRKVTPNPATNPDIYKNDNLISMVVQ